ncbi:MAG: hypothetical protein U0821_08745 [Chloroflexota bacterium]
MILRCATNSLAKCPSAYLDPGDSGWKRIEPLTPKSIYICYAVMAARDGLWYYVLDDRDIPYPIHYPAPLFEVQGGKLSREWVVHHHNVHDQERFTVVISTAAWASEPRFFERLVDGDDATTALFTEYRNRMEREFDLWR